MGHRQGGHDRRFLGRRDPARNRGLPAQAPRLHRAADSAVGHERHHGWRLGDDRVRPRLVGNAQGPGRGGCGGAGGRTGRRTPVRRGDRRTRASLRGCRRPRHTRAHDQRRLHRRRVRGRTTAAFSGTRPLAQRVRRVRAHQPLRHRGVPADRLVGHDLCGRVPGPLRGARWPQAHHRRPLEPRRAADHGAAALVRPLAQGHRQRHRRGTGRDFRDHRPQGPGRLERRGPLAAAGGRDRVMVPERHPQRHPGIRPRRRPGAQRGPRSHGRVPGRLRNRPRQPRAHALHAARRVHTASRPQRPGATLRDLHRPGVGRRRGNNRPAHALPGTRHHGLRRRHPRDTRAGDAERQCRVRH